MLFQQLLSSNKNSSEKAYPPFPEPKQIESITLPTISQLGITGEIKQSNFKTFENSAVPNMDGNFKTKNTF